jgi:hypothetical protein
MFKHDQTAILEFSFRDQLCFRSVHGHQGVSRLDLRRAEMEQLLKHLIVANECIKCTLIVN